jgi:hypothetical protein
LKFLDARAFTAGGSLDTFTRDYSDTVTERVKGYFPYEAITYENYLQVLDFAEPFSYEDFVGAITAEEYEINVNEYCSNKKFETRMQYFLHYNELDTQIMIEPINYLISVSLNTKLIC